MYTHIHLYIYGCIKLLIDWVIDLLIYCFINSCWYLLYTSCDENHRSKSPIMCFTSIPQFISTIQFNSIQFRTPFRTTSTTPSRTPRCARRRRTAAAIMPRHAIFMNLLIYIRWCIAYYNLYMYKLVYIYVYIYIFFFDIYVCIFFLFMYIYIYIYND